MAFRAKVRRPCPEEVACVVIGHRRNVKIEKMVAETRSQQIGLVAYCALERGRSQTRVEK